MIVCDHWHVLIPIRRPIQPTDIWFLGEKGSCSQNILSLQYFFPSQSFPPFPYFFQTEEQMVRIRKELIQRAAIVGREYFVIKKMLYNKTTSSFVNFLTYSVLGSCRGDVKKQ